MVARIPNGQGWAERVTWVAGLAVLTGAVGWGGDLTAPAEFIITPVVSAARPKPMTATVGRGTNNAVNAAGSFEPMVFRWKWYATGDAAAAVPLPEIDIHGWDTFNEGFWDGATVRVYRVANGKLQKVRQDVIPEGGFHCSGWLGGLDMWSPLIRPEAANYRMSFPGWYRPGHTYSFALRAVDSQGNRSVLSNEVGITATLLPGPDVPEGTNAVYYPQLPEAPTETEAPLPPTNFTGAMDEAGLVTFTWTASASPDVIGYEFMNCNWGPADRHGFSLNLSQAPAARSQWVQAGDMVFVDLKSYERSRVRDYSPRVWGTPEAGLPAFWPFFSDGEAGGSARLVPHPGPVPAEFRERGETCLEVVAETAEEVRMLEYNHAGDGQDWYLTLKLNTPYRVEMWLRQEGIPGGRVRFRLGGAHGLEVPEMVFEVNGGWAKYTGTFTLTQPFPNDGGVGSTEVLFQGPGTLWMDNIRVYEEGTEYMDWPAADYQALEEAQVHALRTHGLIKSGYSYTMDSMLNPGGVRGSQGIDGYFNITLHDQLEKFARAGTNPWLQIEGSQDEAEWLALVEYLAAPYDPAVDTPQSKPWAFRRFQNGQQAPWTEAFEVIYFEISNETWNGLAGFEPWSFIFEEMVDAANGRRYGGPEIAGIFQEYVHRVMASSPYWPLLQPKWEEVIGGRNGEPGPQDWGNAALEFSPDIRHVLWANYNGGWDTGATPTGEADDHGRFLALSVVPHSIDGSNRRFAEGREEILAEHDYDYAIGAYEGGPGYNLNGLNGAVMTPEMMEAESVVMKSLAGGTGTLDSFLNGYLYGMQLQSFFTFSRARQAWSSHATEVRGGQPYPPWLALQMYNRYGQGDFLVTAARSLPTWDLPGEQNRPPVPNAPMAACYATRDGNKYQVFVLSRVLDNFPEAGHDGFIPVTLNLPFATVTGMKLYKMEGNPRTHNLDAENIRIEEVTLPVEQFAPRFVLNAARGADARGLPPAASYLYVFEGTAGVSAPAEPTVSIFPASGQGSPTVDLPLRFTVLCSAPVTGLTAEDITFTGSAPVAGYTLERDVTGAGASYTIKIEAISSTGTVQPQIAAGRCVSASTGQPNQASTSAGGEVSFGLPAGAGSMVNLATDDGSCQNDPGVDDVFAGKDGFAYLYGSPADGWAQVMYLRFPVVNAPDRTITRARIRLYNHDDGNPIYALWAALGDDWEEATLTGSSAPGIGERVAEPVQLSGTRGYFEFDVTDFVREEMQEDGIVSVVMAETQGATSGYPRIVCHEGLGAWDAVPIPGDAAPRLMVEWGPENGLPNCLPPVFSPDGGTFTAAPTVTLSCGTEGAIIRYTLDGSRPTPEHGTMASGPVTVAASARLRAIATLAGHNPSGIRNAQFDLFPQAVEAPVFSVEGGVYGWAQDVAITCATPGARVRYTTDGTEPTARTGYLYSGPVNMGVTTTLKAIATLEGWAPSPVRREVYTMVPRDLVNRTAGAGTITALGADDESTGPARVLDNNLWTTFAHSSEPTWIQYQFPEGNAYAITRYVLTPAASGEDTRPRNWTLAGSHNGTDWTVLDTRTDQDFRAQWVSQYYDFENSQAFAYYRLTFDSASHRNYLAELALYSANQPPPTAFELWAFGFGLTGSTAAPGADPDGDMVSNLDEYTWGMNPAAADAGGTMLVKRREGGWALRHRRWAAGAGLIRYERSVDLVHWTRFSPAIQVLGQRVTLAGMVEVVVADLPEWPVGQPFFVRMVRGEEGRGDE